MTSSLEITAEAIEAAFGQQASSARFANFCNAVIVAGYPTVPGGGSRCRWTSRASSALTRSRCGRPTVWKGILESHHRPPAHRKWRVRKLTSGGTMSNLSTRTSDAAFSGSIKPASKQYQMGFKRNIHRQRRATTAVSNSIKWRSQKRSALASDLHMASGPFCQPHFDRAVWS